MQAACKSLPIKPMLQTILLPLKLNSLLAGILYIDLLKRSFVILDKNDSNLYQQAFFIGSKPCTVANKKPENPRVLLNGLLIMLKNFEM